VADELRARAKKRSGSSQAAGRVLIIIMRSIACCERLAVRGMLPELAGRCRMMNLNISPAKTIGMKNFQLQNNGESRVEE
jgi:hypothetical protein